MLTPKPNGDISVTVDMRAPNRAILDTGLPIPKPEDIRKELKGCKVFSKLDFQTAFHQLELDEASRILTVFPHNGKLKRHTRLTMGAKPASGELNKALHLVGRDSVRGWRATRPVQVEAVRAATTPESKSELMSFLNLYPRLALSHRKPLLYKSALQHLIGAQAPISPQIFISRHLPDLRCCQSQTTTEHMKDV